MQLREHARSGRQASRLSGQRGRPACGGTRLVQERTGWKPVCHDRRDACLPMSRVRADFIVPVEACPIRRSPALQSVAACLFRRADFFQ